MSLELENLVKNFEINSLSEELITLTAPFDWSSTSEVILKLQKRVDQLDITLSDYDEMMEAGEELLNLVDISFEVKEVEI
jgi:hypothetical protein